MSVSAPQPARARAARQSGRIRQEVNPTLAKQSQLAGAVAGLDPGAAVELAEQVADVHVDGALADEQLLGDLAVGAADGDVAQDLELAPGQLDVLGRRRRRGCRAAARPTRRARRPPSRPRRRAAAPPAWRRSGRRRRAAPGPPRALRRRRGRPRPAVRPGPARAGSPGCGGARPRARGCSAAASASPSSRASSPTAWARAATASSWPPSAAICPSAEAQSCASVAAPVAGEPARRPADPPDRVVVVLAFLPAGEQLAAVAGRRLVVEPFGGGDDRQRRWSSRQYML